MAFESVVKWSLKKMSLNHDFIKIFRILKINPANLENLGGIVVQDKKQFGFGRPKPKEYRQ